jgi:alpha-ribazole phosphatase CobZ
MSTVGLVEFLGQQGVGLRDLVDCGLEFFVPHPGVESREKAEALLREELLDACKDANVCVLVFGAFLLQREAEAGKVPGLSMEVFRGRPGLVADELIGLAIANYIAGARGMFEFTRFDMAKPGILKRLGPITNDAVGGLIAGCSSNMYTRALRCL